MLEPRTAPMRWVHRASETKKMAPEANEAARSSQASASSAPRTAPPALDRMAGARSRSDRVTANTSVVVAKHSQSEPRTPSEGRMAYGPNSAAAEAPARLTA